MSWPLSGSEAGLDFVWYKPICFSHAHVDKLAWQEHYLDEKSAEVCIKTKLTQYTTVNGLLRKQRGPLLTESSSPYFLTRLFWLWSQLFTFLSSRLYCSKQLQYHRFRKRSFNKCSPSECQVSLPMFWKSSWVWWHMFSPKVPCSLCPRRWTGPKCESIVKESRPFVIPDGDFLVPLQACFPPGFKSWQVLSPLPSHVKDTGNTRWVLIGYHDQRTVWSMSIDTLTTQRRFVSMVLRLL